MESLYTFINIGFGDTYLLRLRQTIVMVDCWESEEVGDRLIDHLPEGRVDLLILTHRHFDHYFGIKALLHHGVDVHEVWETPWLRRDDDTSLALTAEMWQRCQALVDELRARGARHRYVSRDDGIIGLGQGHQIQVLNPAGNINEVSGTELHDGCLVLMLGSSTNPHEILFCGDAYDRVLERIAASDDVSDVYILCASHHGSIDSANEALLSKASPEYVIVSALPGTYGTIPDAEALDLYRRFARRAVRCTFQEGTICLRPSEGSSSRDSRQPGSGR